MIGKIISRQSIKSNSNTSEELVLELIFLKILKIEENINKK